MVDAIRGGVNPDNYRVVHRITVDEAEPLLTHGLVNACILDMDLTDVQGIWLLEKLFRRAPKCPVILYAGSQWKWEEEAYLQGVAHVLNKPVRPRLLAALLDRLWEPGAVPRPGQPAATSFPQEIATNPRRTGFRTLPGLPTRLVSFVIFPGFSLTPSMPRACSNNSSFCSGNPQHQPGGHLLRAPFASFGAAPTMEENRRLRSACAVGLSPSLLQHFELSFEAGIGGHIFRLDAFCVVIATKPAMISKSEGI